MIGLAIFLPICIIYLILGIFAVFHLLRFGLTQDKKFINKTIAAFIIISFLLLFLFAVFLLITPWDSLMPSNYD